MSIQDHLHIQGRLHVQGNLHFGASVAPPPANVGFWVFNAPIAGTSITSFSVSTSPPTLPVVVIAWGDGTSTVANNGVNVSHTY